MVKKIFAESFLTIEKLADSLIEEKDIIKAKDELRKGIETLESLILSLNNKICIARVEMEIYWSNSYNPKSYLKRITIIDLKTHQKSFERISEAHEDLELTEEDFKTIKALFPPSTKTALEMNESFEMGDDENSEEIQTFEYIIKNRLLDYKKYEKTIPHPTFQGLKD